MDDTCKECGFNDTAATPTVAAEGLAAAASAITEVVAGMPEQMLRWHSAPNVWSAIEYLGHLRESIAFHRWLIERAQHEATPVIPAVDPDASVTRAGYQTSDVEALLGQFSRRIQRLTALLTRLDDQSLQRNVILDSRVITVGLMARSAWHECWHHLGDIRRIAQSYPLTAPPGRSGRRLTGCLGLRRRHRQLGRISCAGEAGQAIRVHSSQYG